MIHDRTRPIARCCPIELGAGTNTTNTTTMTTNTIRGTYGSGRNRCDIYTYAYRGGHWYAVHGSHNVNFTHDDIAEGVNVEALADTDSFTWPDGIYDEEDLERAVEDGGEEEDPFERYDDQYDVEAMRMDNANGNFSHDRAKDYLKVRIVKNSLINGQFGQARRQCESYDLDYDTMRIATLGH